MSNAVERLPCRWAELHLRFSGVLYLRRAPKFGATEDRAMRKWALVWMAMLSIGFCVSASAGNWSIGYSDHGRHGGYNLTVGSHGYRSVSAFSYAPSWGYSGRSNYRDSWRDPWYLNSYRAPVRSYYGSGYGYRNHSYRPNYDYRPRHSYRSYSRDHGRRYDRYNDYRYNRRSFNDNHRNGRDYAHDRNDRYRRSESAHQRARRDSDYTR